MSRKHVIVLSAGEVGGGELGVKERESMRTYLDFVDEVRRSVSVFSS
jgi:hypothetical protein